MPLVLGVVPLVTSVGAVRGRPHRTRAGPQGRGTCLAARASGHGRTRAAAEVPSEDLGCPDSETGTCEVPERGKRKVNGASPRQRGDLSRSQKDLGCPDSETGVCDVPGDLP